MSFYDIVRRMFARTLACNIHTLTRGKKMRQSPVAFFRGELEMKLSMYKLKEFQAI